MLLRTSLDAAVEEDGTSGFVIEVFDDSDKVNADGALLRGCLRRSQASSTWVQL